MDIEENKSKINGGAGQNEINAKKIYDFIITIINICIIDANFLNCVQEAIHNISLPKSIKTNDKKVESYSKIIPIIITNILNKMNEIKSISILNIHGHIGTFLSGDFNSKRLNTKDLYNNIINDLELNINQEAYTTLVSRFCESFVSSIKLDDKNKILQCKLSNKNFANKYSYLPFSIDSTYIDSKADKFYKNDLYKTIGNIAYISYDVKKLILELKSVHTTVSKPKK